MSFFTPLNPFHTASKTHLRRTYLLSVDLNRANLSEADLSEAIILSTNLLNAKNLTEEQLNGNNPPFVCNSLFPPNLEIDSDRDCNRLPEALNQRYEDIFDTVDQAKRFVDLQRTKSWKKSPPAIPDQ